MRYIDSHVHFWDASRLSYPWLSRVPMLSGSYLPADYDKEISPQQPEKLVFIEADVARNQATQELDWVHHLTKAEPRIAAIVPHVSLDQGTATETALRNLSRQPLVRGVRHLIQGEENSDFCVRPEFIKGVRSLAAYGLSFDICCTHQQLQSVVQLVRLCPDTTFILDHAGKPDLRTGEIGNWIHSIAALALFPNVFCKLSGLATETSGSNCTLATFRPVIAHLFKTFTPARLLFGSDWPVVGLACTPRKWLNLAQELLAELTPHEQEAVFFNNATRIYRL